MKRRGAQTDIPVPTPAEMLILLVLWRVGEGTVEQIVAATETTPPPNYKTTQTILRIMESKGLVEHRARGRAFVFFPKVAREQVNRGSLRSILKRNFAGSRMELLLNLLEDEQVSAEELASLEALVRQRRAEAAGGKSKL